MNLHDKPHQKSGYRLEELDGELLLYHPTRTTIMYCDPTASLIWQLCDGERTVAQIVALLSTAYDQPAERMIDDVTTILEQFQLHQALE